MGKKMFYHTTGSDTVISKICISGLPVPINATKLANQLIPHLQKIPTSSGYIMEWIKQVPKINTEYYVSKEMEDVVDYRNNFDLQHQYIVVLKDRKKCVVKIDRKYIYITYQRGKTLELEFNNRSEARVYWEGLRPEMEITDLKRYLKQHTNLTYLKGI